MILPNPVQFARSLWSNLHYWLKFGRLMANPDVVAARSRQCVQCAYLKGAQCSICTCFYVGKVALAAESCPIGRWGPVKTKKWSRLWRLIR